MILILNCSPRKKGVTTSVLKAMADGISAENQIEWIDVNKLSIKPCIGCLKCRPDKECVLPPDDAHRIGKLLKTSDLLIVGTPTYWGNITGPLKLLFDRNVPTFEYIEGGKLPRPNLKGKKAIIVIASAGPFPFNLLPSQSGGTVRALKTVLRSGGYKIVRTINIPNANHFDKVKTKLLTKAKTIGESFSRLSTQHSERS
jgi:NAD(P)H-dependent FMN reductase